MWRSARCRSRRNSRVHLTPKKWNELVAVNAEVNRDIMPATDEQIYGVPEYWAYPDKIGEGDCEDLVLLKRRDLIKEGLADRRAADHRRAPDGTATAMRCSPC